MVAGKKLLITGVVTRDSIAAGPRNIWRYADLLPSGADPASGGG